MRPGARWILALCAVPSVLVGQTFGRPLQVGDRIRITSPTDTGVYIVRALSPDTLTVQIPSSQALAAFPLTTLREVEISRGPERFGRRMLRRGTTGLLVGGAIGGVLGYASGDDPREEWFAMTRSEKAGLGAAVVGTVGLLIGTIASISRSERWERVSLPPRVSVSRRGPGVFALSYSF